MNIVLLIILLLFILVILIVLNNLSVVRVTNVEYEKDEDQATCMNTHYGCCPDGVNSKINFFGTNCPGFTPPPPPPGPEPPGPGPIPPKPIGGCSGTRFGCCPNNITPKMNQQGTNCMF